MSRKKALLSNIDNVAPKVKKYKLRSSNTNDQESREKGRFSSLLAREDLIPEVKNLKLQSVKANSHETREKVRTSSLNDKENMVAVVKKSKLRSGNANVHEPQGKERTSSLVAKENLTSAVKKSKLRSGNANNNQQHEQQVKPSSDFDKENVNSGDTKSKLRNCKVNILKPQENIMTSTVFDKENLISAVKNSKLRSRNVTTIEHHKRVRSSSIFDKENLISGVKKSKIRNCKVKVHKPQEKVTTSTVFDKENMGSGVKKSTLQTCKVNVHQPQEKNTSLLFNKENLIPNVKKSKLQNHNAHLSEPEERDAIYEFTYDPKEEPPNKKGCKQKVKSKAKTRPKLAIITNRNYGKNISNKLEILKNTLQEKTDHGNVLKRSNKENEFSASLSKETTPTRVPQCDDVPIDYSPAPLLQTPQAVTPQATRSKSISREEINQKDPLNLLDEPSFDYEPVASSSFNTSVRHPEASPWRVEFNELPIKWQVNSYTKSNMTPAVETSFVNFNESQKKHVYTNLVPEAEETLPDIVNENGGVRLKQTSLIDFITDAAVRSVRKQKRKALKETDVPSRANLPKTALNFYPSSELVNKLYNEMKMANEAPVVPVACEDIRDIAVEENVSMVDNDDSQSCHLFEDVDVVHHVKPSRKSYSRAKKLTFVKPTMDSMLPSDDLPSDIEDEQAEYSDSTFELPNIKNNRKINRKKKATKQNKKEAEEVEAWAAAFNSMCEDVDGFDLVIE